MVLDLKENVDKDIGKHCKISFAASQWNQSFMTSPSGAQVYMVQSYKTRSSPPLSVFYGSIDDLLFPWKFILPGDTELMEVS